ncbi:DUF1561 domain-containing protein [Helicobacter sp. faydin-H20]|uniref:DUF1561 family protein n=1 Tax=Helicobacter anatolicus TaxID=2905874 RepID=UPI001E415C3D|nr:DUF1561 family protein [Helicobacter anatolicus]MCE3036828.1 DUF1561 domain-containing protein [Helicobacter anatolicus]
MIFILIGLLGFVNANTPDAVVQKLADDPVDRTLNVDIGEEYYCFTPVFDSKDGYLQLDISSCGTKGVSPSRYDVFQRVAFKVNSTWLCLTAPDNVTGYEGEKVSSWDYAILRPCVINDPNQRWVIKNNAFYTYDSKYRLQHNDKFYAVISEGNTYANHTLNTRMEQWRKTIARPATIAVKTFLSWSLDSKSYYIEESVSKSPLLYYNTQDGRIFSYLPSNGRQKCLATSQLKDQQWNWASWVLCDDLSDLDYTHWNLFAFVGGTGEIKDKNGNLLRVTRYGSNWGVPYTASPSYLQTDTTNSPTSEFSMSEDVDKWLRYAYGNMGDNLTYCPAPGTAKIDEHSRTKRQLPPAFELTDAWIDRLYTIATTAISGTTPAVGLCGTCLLHVHEMLAELMRHGYGNPPTTGHFFDVARHTNPFLSFTQRFPDLAARLDGVMNYRDYPLTPGEDQWVRRRRVLYATNQAFSPQNNWAVTEVVRTQEDMRNLYMTIMDSPPGSLWTISMTYTRTGTNMIGHAQPMIRTQQGLIIIPTNTPTATPRSFRAQLAPFTTPDQFIHWLNDRRIIHAVFAFRVSEAQQSSYDRFISVSNCTGEGEGSRGSATFPRINAINQCVSGRCAIQ